VESVAYIYNKQRRYGLRCKEGFCGAYIEKKGRGLLGERKKDMSDISLNNGQVNLLVGLKLDYANSNKLLTDQHLRKNRTRKLMPKDECDRKNEQLSDRSTVYAVYTIQL